MPMRVDCKHYDSRTYGEGEVVRKCRLDLAPEAPWRCPDDCPAFALRLVDVGWQRGSFGHDAGAQPPEPEPEGEDIAALLDSAEDIINAAAPEILAEFQAKEKKSLFNRAKRKKNNNAKNKKKR